MENKIIRRLILWIAIGLALVLLVLVSTPFQLGFNDNSYNIGNVGLAEKDLLCQGSGWGFRSYEGLDLLIYKWGCLASPQ